MNNTATKSIRDKNHEVWKAIRLLAEFADTVCLAVYSFLKFVFVLPFLLLIIIFIGRVPDGALEIGKD